MYLNTIAIISLTFSAICALVIVIDILLGHQQHMMVMNFVYPITALYAGPLALIFYYRVGRKTTNQTVMNGKAA